MPYAGSRWLAEVPCSRVPALLSSPQGRSERQREPRDPLPTASPIHAASVRCSQSSLQPNTPPPTGTDAPAHAPGPSAPLGPGPPEKTSFLPLGSWLHLLKCWRLRQTRGRQVINFKNNVAGQSSDAHGASDSVAKS